MPEWMVQTWGWKFQALPSNLLSLNFSLEVVCLLHMQYANKIYLCKIYLTHNAIFG